MNMMLWLSAAASQGYTPLYCGTECRVAVVSKVHVTRSHSVAAQGGIAASLGNEEEDHWEWHMYDTVKGSDYLADQDVAEILAKEAPNAIITLEHMGVPFTRNQQGKIEQRRFGGHTRNYGEAPVKRACYVSDRTGRAIMDTLYDRCKPKASTYTTKFSSCNCCFQATTAAASQATTLRQVNRRFSMQKQSF